MTESEYSFKRVYDTSALEGFYCGEKSMDDFIHDKARGLDRFIKLGVSNLWVVSYEGEVVAMFALGKDALVLNNEDRIYMQSKSSCEKDEDKFWSQEKYPAIEIDYLAIRREARCKHIGSLIVAAIEQKALQDTLSATMFLTVDAFNTAQYSAVGFYLKCGFAFSEVAQNKYNFDVTFGSRPTVRRMYKILLRAENIAS